jgi:hypothetical protein
LAERVHWTRRPARASGNIKKKRKEEVERVLYFSDHRALKVSASGLLSSLFIIIDRQYRSSWPIGV